MNRRTLAAVLLTLAPSAAFGQAAKAAAPSAAAPKVPAAIVGTWEGQSVNSADKKVITTYTMTWSADGKGEQTLAGRKPLAVRLIAAGGDSVVGEVGPYESVLKKGVQATTRSVTHYKGDSFSGTFEAKYSDGTSVKGTTTGNRKGAKK